MSCVSQFYSGDRLLIVVAPARTRWNPIPIEVYGNTTIDYPVLNAKEREIRLLTVKFNERREIHGYFTVISLKQPVKYTALSYVWGSEPPECIIWIEYRPFGVRPGLFAYLQLAATEETVGQGIFIDAICINQMSVTEKGSQIALMGSLYEQAYEVTVWFGDGSSWLSQLVEKYPAIVDPAVLRSCLLREATEHLTAQDALDISAAIGGKVISHEYWGRVWTAQEFVLPNELVLRLGILRFDFATWFDVLRDPPGANEPISTLEVGSMQSARFTVSHSSRTPLHESHWREHIRCNQFAIGRISHADTAPLRKGLLFHAILYFSEQECCIPQDRIFGLLGLCKSGIRPNYDTPTIELYIEIYFKGIREIRSQFRGAELEMYECKFVASLLSCLGIRLEHPAVFLVTLLAFDPMSDEAQKFIRHVFQLNMDLWHPQLNELLQCQGLLELVGGLQSKAAFSAFFRLMKNDGRIAGYDGESYTVTQWLKYVDQAICRRREKFRPPRRPFGIAQWLAGGSEEMATAKKLWHECLRNNGLDTLVTCNGKEYFL
ncbi:hypothetical protein LTR56_002680 [Elasticomyces elasticus]|nr:hypothetical protein LTR22_014904 [Elasticomyces elasticus]KAK3657164.1 hypothetical protein LTR56_002680 [Elasticomyces elasticus]KAK4914363.1 hypothetical protein LTR49_017394 [Elasticomyces elasticus]KAK5753856.1 hypothetical protein LTS12_016059 [Elasticomyces elasticus]